MKPPRQPDLELRGKLVRSLGSLREMLPGAFERSRWRGGRYAWTKVVAIG